MEKDVEYRINIIADIQPSPTSKGIEKKLDETPSSLPKEQPTDASSVGSALSASFFIHSGQKLISATGNNQLTKGIGDVVKYGTLSARAFTGDVTAIASLAVDLASQAIKKVNELKQEAQMNNQARYNQMLSGQLFLGSNQQINVSKDWIGNIYYNRN